MKPIHVHSRTRVDAPAADAWAFLSVYANDPAWRRGVSRMEQSPPGPVVDGASTVEHLRMLGRDMVNVAHVSEVRAGESFAWRVNDGADAHGSRRIVAVDDRTCEIVIDKEVRLAASDRWMRPLVAWVLQRTERGDLRRAARLIEAQAGV